MPPRGRQESQTRDGKNSPQFSVLSLEDRTTSGEGDPSTSAEELAFYQKGDVIYARKKSSGTVGVVPQAGDAVTWAGAHTFSSTISVAGGSTFAAASFSGVVSFADGTAALPSITNTGDTATGVLFPAAGAVGVAGLGVEAFRVSVPTDLTDAVATFYGTLDASSSTVGAVVMAGGLAVAKKAYVGTTLTVGGVISAFAGTLGAPGVTTTGDVDTGVYFPAANTIGIVGFGAEALRVAVTTNLTDSVVTSYGTLDATDSTTSSFVIAGGLAVAKKLYVGTALDVGTTGTFAGIISVDDTTDTTSGITGSIHTDGGLGVAKAVYAGTTITSAGRMLCDDVTDATSTTDGSIQTDGGLSVALDAFVGGNVHADNVVKAWVNFNASAIITHWNASGFTDTTTGDWDIIFDTDFAGVDYIVIGGCNLAFNSIQLIIDSATQTRFLLYDGANAPSDSTDMWLVAYGAQ